MGVAGVLTLGVIVLARERAPAPPQDVARAATLYAEQCLVCHGATGAGDGQGAYLLSPAPRDFTSGRFRLSSTQNGVPTDDDLVATLKRGMPGSAMPPWDWMSDSDLRGLAAYVRRLAIDGKTKVLLAKAKSDEEELPEKEAREIAERQLTPGPAIEVGAAPPADPVAFQEGRRFFLKTCALCHGADGTGRGGKDQKNEDGTPTQPRDFTAGVFKGGSSAQDIVTRLRAGMSGSPMPAMSFDDPNQAWNVARFVESLVKPGAQERVAQHRRTIRVRRVQGELPRDAGDPAWQRAEGTYLAVAPLWWRDDRCEGLVLRALHDGKSLAVRLSWEDATKDDEILGQDIFPDAAAVQISAAKDPPAFTMGSKGSPVNLWMWKAAWERDLERVRDIADYRPNTPPDFYGHVAQAEEPMYLTAAAAGNPDATRKRATAGEELSAEGFGTLAPVTSRGEFSARGSWTDGFWDVVFVRSMKSAGPGEIALAPGSRAYLAAALWDGAHKDRNGQKSVTVWHVLEIEP
jgi:mono/diheme cytochrome c family protein